MNLFLILSAYWFHFSEH